jgi:hypothetical protein
MLMAIPLLSGATDVAFSNAQCAVLRQMRVDTREICPGHKRGPNPPAHRAQSASYSPAINGSMARPGNADTGGGRPAGGAGNSSGESAGSGPPGSSGGTPPGTGEPGTPGSGNPDRPGIGGGDGRILRPSQLPSGIRPSQPEVFPPDRPTRRPKIDNDIRGDVEHPRFFVKVVRKLRDQGTTFADSVESSRTGRERKGRGRNSK